MSESKATNHRLPGAVFFALLIACGVGGCIVWNRHSDLETTDDAFLEGHVYSVSARVNGPLVKVLVDDNQEVEKGQLLAEIDPEDYRVRLARAKAALQVAEERSHLAHINVGLVSTTSEAAVELASADVEGSRSSVLRAQTAVATSGRSLEGLRSRLKGALAQVQTARHGFRQAQAQVAGLRSEARRTANDLHRYQLLFGHDEVTRQQLDNAEAASKLAAANLEAAERRSDAARSQVAEANASVEASRHALEQAESGLREAEVHVQEIEAQANASRARLASAQSAPQQIAVRRSDQKASRGEVESARAAVQEAELNLKYTGIYAPASGRVTRKSIEVGTYVSPGQPLLSVVGHDVWVVANFKEHQITHMAAGQAVDVRVDAFPDLHLKAHVQSLQAGSGSRYALLPPENATGNHVKVAQRVPVKIVFDDSVEKLTQLGPGMSVVPAVRLR